MTAQKAAYSVDSQGPTNRLGNLPFLLDLYVNEPLQSPILNNDLHGRIMIFYPTFHTPHSVIPVSRPCYC
jgi:hypothetical protein